MIKTNTGQSIPSASELFDLIRSNKLEFNGNGNISDFGDDATRFWTDEELKTQIAKLYSGKVYLLIDEIQDEHNPGNYCCDTACKAVERIHIENKSYKEVCEYLFKVAYRLHSSVSVDEIQLVYAESTGLYYLCGWED